jgi:hypothetical protein
MTMTNVPGGSSAVTTTVRDLAGVVRGEIVTAADPG